MRSNFSVPDNLNFRVFTALYLLILTPIFPPKSDLIRHTSTKPKGHFLPKGGKILPKNGWRQIGDRAFFTLPKCFHREVRFCCTRKANFFARDRQTFFDHRGRVLKNYVNYNTALPLHKTSAKESLAAPPFTKVR